MKSNKSFCSFFLFSLFLIIPCNASTNLSAVELFEKGDCFQVVTVSVNIGIPFTGFSAVVEVEHRSHGVNANTVNVVASDPIIGAGNEEALHLGSANVKSPRSPALVLDSVGGAVFIKGRAVKLAEQIKVVVVKPED